MKQIKAIAVSLAVLSLAACSSNGKAAKGGNNDSTAVAEAPVNPKTLLPSKSMKDSVSYLLGVNFGSFIKGYNFGEVNFSQVERGMKDFIKAKGDVRDSTFLKQFKISPELMNDLFNEYLQKMNEYTLAVNTEKEEKFLAENAKKAGVQVTESGLQYVITEPGNGVKPGPKDTVFVKYRGTLPDGKVFDEATDTAKFTLNRVVRGWTEGLQLIGEGGKETLVIPSKLAYGQRGSQGIEPNTPLTFEVELLKVSPFVEPEIEDDPTAPVKK